MTEYMCHSSRRRPVTVLHVLPLVTKMMMVALVPSANGFLSQCRSPMCPEPSLLRLDMFTGIIEEVGTVVSLKERDDMELYDGTKGKGTELTVKADVVMDGAYQGCSICVSGVCLTATNLDPDKSTFQVGIAPETLRRSYLGSLHPGDKVNLERASEIGGRNSGHFVQGHVDGFAKITDKWQEDDSLFFQIKVPPGDIMNYIVEKGFVAIDGASLTVCEVDPDENWFTFMLVEFTQKKIILPDKKIGDSVNIEVDVLGKYSDNAMKAILPRIEELEFQYESLQTKARELEAVNKGLVHKLQSLESARLLENGNSHIIPDARMVSGPEATMINDEWLRQQAQQREQRFPKNMRRAEPGPVRDDEKPPPRAQRQQQPQRRPPQPNPKQQRRNGQQKEQQDSVRRVKGPEAARINNEWRQQQEQMRDQYKVRRIQDENLPFAGVEERKMNEAGRKRVVGGPDARRIQDEWLRSQGKTIFEQEMMKESNIQDAKIIDVGDRDPFMGLSPDQDKKNTDALRIEFEGNFAPEAENRQPSPFQDTPVIRNGVRHPAAQKGPEIRDAKVVSDERWNQRPSQFSHLPDAKQVANRQQQPSQQKQQHWNQQPGPGQQPNNNNNNNNRNMGQQPDRRMLDQRPAPGNQQHLQPPGPHNGPTGRLFERPPPEHFARNGNSNNNNNGHHQQQHPPPPPPPNGHNPYFEPMGEFADPWYDQSGRNPDMGGAGIYGPDDFQEQTRHAGTRDVILGMEPDHGLKVNENDNADYPKTRAVYHDQWPGTFGMSQDGRKNW